MRNEGDSYSTYLQLVMTQEHVKIKLWFDDDFVDGLKTFGEVPEISQYFSRFRKKLGYIMMKAKNKVLWN